MEVERRSGRGLSRAMASDPARSNGPYETMCLVPNVNDMNQDQTWSHLVSIYFNLDYFINQLKWNGAKCVSCLGLCLLPRTWALRALTFSVRSASLKKPAEFSALKVPGWCTANGQKMSCKTMVWGVVGLSQITDNKGNKLSTIRMKVIGILKRLGLSKFTREGVRSGTYKCEFFWD